MERERGERDLRDMEGRREEERGTIRLYNIHRLTNTYHYIDVLLKKKKN